MNIEELLGSVVEALERIGAHYLVTGSMATIAYGEPRFTNDIDVAVRLPFALADALCDQFPDSDFYLSRELVREVARGGGQFNIIHPASGLKVDVMVVDDSDFNASRFSRGRPVPIADGRTAIFAAPEDAILKKLEFYRDGGSDKHVRDIVGVLTTSSDIIDRRYIDRWANRLGLSAVWAEILGAMGE